VKPDTTHLVAPTLMTTAGGSIGSKPLAATRRYTIAVDRTRANSGSMTLTLYDPPQVPLSTLPSRGATATATGTVRAQNAALALARTAGQGINLENAATSSQAKLTILNPHATTLMGPLTVSSAGGFIDTRTLPATGTYTIAIDPTAANTGSITFTVYD